MIRKWMGKIGRRYWIERVSRALDRAHEQGLIGSWLLHEIDHRIKYAADPGKPYGPKPPALARKAGGG